MIELSESSVAFYMIEKDLTEDSPFIAKSCIILETC